MKITTKKLTAKEMIDMKIKNYLYINPALLQVSGFLVLIGFGIYIHTALVHIQNVVQANTTLIQQWNANIPN